MVHVGLSLPFIAATYPPLSGAEKTNVVMEASEALKGAQLLLPEAQRHRGHRQESHHSSSRICLDCGWGFLVHCHPPLLGPFVPHARFADHFPAVLRVMGKKSSAGRGPQKKTTQAVAIRGQNDNWKKIALVVRGGTNKARRWVCDLPTGLPTFKDDNTFYSKSSRFTLCAPL